MKKKIIVMAVLLFIAGMAVGYNLGFISALRFAVELGVHFLEAKGINLDINENMVAMALYQWKGQIGGCLFLNNNTEFIRWQMR